MPECRTCGVSDGIITENASLSTKLDEAEVRIEDLEQALSGDVCSPEQIQLFKPYQKRPRRPF